MDGHLKLRTEKVLEQVEQDISRLSQEYTKTKLKAEIDFVCSNFNIHQLS